MNEVVQLQSEFSAYPSMDCSLIGFPFMDYLGVIKPLSSSPFLQVIFLNLRLWTQPPVTSKTLEGTKTFAKYHRHWGTQNWKPQRVVTNHNCFQWLLPVGQRVLMCGEREPCTLAWECKLSRSHYAKVWRGYSKYYNRGIYYMMQQICLVYLEEQITMSKIFTPPCLIKLHYLLRSQDMAEPGGPTNGMQDKKMWHVYNTIPQWEWEKLKPCCFVGSYSE